jgi:hypothetical protein
MSTENQRQFMEPTRAQGNDATCTRKDSLFSLDLQANLFFVYHVTAVPVAENSRVIVSLVVPVAPIAGSIVLLTVNMILVYLKVRAQAAASNRWRFDSHTSTNSSLSATPAPSTSKMERAVFWQSLFYLAAFYLTWPLSMTAYLDQSKLDHLFRYWLALVTIAPVQGFLNAIVYCLFSRF